jgi:SUF system NifU family Fe-S assembly protein
MYQEVILDHYKHPHGRGLRDGDAEVHHVNPTCGDEITLRVKYDGERIEDISYEGQGCSISQASASVLNDLLVGKDVTDAQKIQETFLASVTSLPTSSSFSTEALAWLIEQPWPSYETSPITVPSIRTRRVISSPQVGLTWCTSLWPARRPRPWGCL